MSLCNGLGFSGDNWSAFELELATIQSLRGQLEDGIEHNKRLRSSLEKQIAAHEETLRQERQAASGEYDRAARLYNNCGWYLHHQAISRLWLITYGGLRAILQLTPVC